MVNAVLAFKCLDHQGTKRFVAIRRQAIWRPYSPNLLIHTQSMNPISSCLGRDGGEASLRLVEEF
jgi:hypothetical protein